MTKAAPLGHLVLTLACICTSGHAAALRSAHVQHNADAHVHGHARTTDQGRVEEATALRMNAALMDTVTIELMKHNSVHFPKHKKGAITKKLRKVDLRATVGRLAHKVPQDVATLLRVSIEGQTKQPFPEASLAKALAVLNELLLKALNELDDVIIECKTFEDKNRGTFDQVMTDIARLGESIADLERMDAESQESINVKEAEIQSISAELHKEIFFYLKNLFEDRREMAIRKGDLAVFQFMMQLTKCEATSLIQ